MYGVKPPGYLAGQRQNHTLGGRYQQKPLGPRSPVTGP